jgi:threonine dehydrogenase-like Zn-dependent dehydrogenase
MRELEITTSMAYSSEEFQKSLEILSNNVIDQNKFISHKCAIQDYKKAFDLAKNGNIATKVMFEI